MNFNAFPPSVLAGVSVAKGQTASRPESGLAGQVNLLTLRPLDIGKLEDKNSFTNLSVRGSLNDIDDETGFRASVLTAWRNDDNDLGGYISLVTADENNARDQLRVNYKTKDLKIDTTGDGKDDSLRSEVLVPSAITMNPIRENAKRTAIATGIQYLANDDVEINWDLMYSSYNNESHRDQAQFAINHKKTWAKAIFDMSDSANPALVIDENNTLRYADFGLSSKGNAIVGKSTTLLFNNKTENLITGLNIDWAISDSFTSNFDVYLSTVDYSQDLRFPRFPKNLDNSQFVYDATGLIPSITAPGVQEVAGYTYDSATVREISTEAENFGLTAKFNYDISDNAVFSSIDFGIHFDETTIKAKRSSGEKLTLDAAGKADMIANALTGDITDQDFLGGDGFSPQRWIIADYDAAVVVDPRIASTSWDDLDVDPLQSYDMTESIFSLYGQVNLETEIFDLPLSGNVGVRAVLTDNEASAEQNVDGVVMPVTVSNDYWQYLPSLNLNLALNDDMALRFGLSKTLSRPDYQQLAPINRINLGDDEGDIGSATVGNPYLEPMTSVNIDITYEWYTQYDGAFVLSGFYKEVSDFIIQDTIIEVPLPGYEGLYNVKTFINASDGNAKGYEIGLFQPLDKVFSALAGFGFSVNYTFVDSEFDEDVGDGGYGFPGSSQDNFNFIGFYEADSYAIRLAYVYRSEFFRSLAGTGSQSSTARFTGEQEKLNLSVNVKPMKGLSVKFAANNITDEKRRDFMGHESTFMDYFDRGRTYSITANYRF